MGNRIAIIICAYNDSKFLWNVYNNVINQGADEIIFVDDQSNDGSDVIFEAMKKDGKVKVLYNDGPKGVLGAFKKGLEATTCDWISWLACDDELHENNIRVMKETISQINYIDYDLICCGAKVIREGKEYEKKLINVIGFITPEYWTKIVKAGLSRQFTGCGSIARKTLLEKCLKDCPIKTNLDCLYMYYTMFEKGFVYFNLPMAMYRSYPNSFGNSLRAVEVIDAFDYIEKFCAKNLPTYKFMLMIESGILKRSIMSPFLVWIFVRLPKFIRMRFYDSFYSYDLKVEKL